jgi:hypothetical protein
MNKRCSTCYWWSWSIETLATETTSDNSLAGKCHVFPPENKLGIPNFPTTSSKDFCPEHKIDEEKE